MLLLEVLLLTSTRETLPDAAVWLSLLLAEEEEEEIEEEEGEEEEEDGKEEAFVVDEEAEEEEVLDDDEEEPLVQAALDSSPKGFRNTGACSSTVSASMVGTDKNAAVSLWPTRRVCCPSQAAGSLGMLGRSPPSVALGLHSAPTSAQAPVPLIISVSAKTLPPAPARTSASVSVQTAAPAPANTLPSGQAPRPSPRSTSVPTIASLSLITWVAERWEGTAGSGGKTARLIDSWWRPSAVENTREREMEKGKRE